MISQRFSIGPADAAIAMLQWGESGRPPALLVHGTGFVAAVWDEVARDLASTYTVYALDRRGHGASHKPATYHFADYADDICRVIDALDLRDVYGIGHSAGATDLLLAAKLLPARFTRLFVMEPTVMKPPAAGEPSARLSEQSLARVQGALRRQAEFDSPDAVFAPRRACLRGLDRRCAVGLCAARFHPAGRRQGAPLLHARDRVGDAASDLRGDGAGLCRRRARQSLCPAR
jgi:pimeloyl-ACP methyl ester carboxylesterase